MKLEDSKNFAEVVGTVLHIYIYGDFDNSITQHVVPAIVRSTFKSIIIHINSDGGDVSVLNTLLCALTTTGVMVTTIVEGVAGSCGSLLAIMGHSRLMYRDAFHWIHWGSWCLEATGPKDVQRVCLAMQETFAQVSRRYQERCGFDPEKLHALLDDNCTIMFSAECLENGMCDKIIG